MNDDQKMSTAKELVARESAARPVEEATVVVPSRRRISGAELEQCCRDHKLWLESDGADGARAELARTDLSGHEIVHVDLRSADLRDVDLSDARIEDSDLRGANLSLARFERTCLRDSDLRETQLNGVDLTRATSLLPEKLAAANLAGAKLPDEILGFEGLRTVESASISAHRMLIGMLVACLYSWVSIASMTDAQLIANTASSPLPIIGTPVSIAGFCIVAPVLLLAVFIYLNIYVQRLWEMLAKLPAVFPDGRPLDEKAYPWLLNGLVRADFKLLFEKRLRFSKLQVALVILLTWCVVPFTILLFWARYLRLHHWPGTVFHSVMVVAACFFGAFFYQHARATLRRNALEPVSWQTQPHCLVRRSVAVIGVFVLAVSVSAGAIEGVTRRESLAVPFTGPDRPWLWQVLIPAAAEGIGFSVFANLDGAEVAPRPQNGTGADEDGDSVRSINFEGRDLRFASATGAFLVRARLTGTDLTGAGLLGADLRGATLLDVNLTYANLIIANLAGARLQGANLAEADLLSADLAKASLAEANLTRTWLQLSDLSGAELSGANLNGTDLREANLSGANFSKVTFSSVSWGLANVWGLRNPPPGLLESALANGAVCVENPEDWSRLRADPEAVENAVHRRMSNCFPVERQP